MKNLFYSLCLLIVFSTSAQATNYQIKEPNTSQKMFIKATSFVSSILFTNTIEEIAIEEEDEAFDFNIKNYLPENFNAFAGLFDVFDSANEEEDEAFDFDTTAYLPVGFNATIHYGDEVYAIAASEEEDEAFDFNTTAYLPVGFNATISLDTEAYELVNVEEDETFNFNTTDYLPIGFNANTAIYDTIVEIAIEETDEPFEFDTMDYIPEGFNAYQSHLAVSTLYYFNCIGFTSI